MDWKKPSPELGLVLEKALLGVTCRGRPMFGCPAYFAGDHMFAGVYGDQLFVRTSGGERDALLARYPDCAPFEPMPGRRMKEYLVLPPEALDDAEALARILGRAFSSAAALPPKPPKSTTSAKPRKKGGR